MQRISCKPKDEWMDVAVNTGTFPVSHCPWSSFQFVFIDQPLDYFNKITDFINKITTTFHFYYMFSTCCYYITTCWKLSLALAIVQLFSQFSNSFFGVLVDFTWTFCPAGLGVYQDVSGVAATNHCRQPPVTSAGSRNESHAFMHWTLEKLLTSRSLQCFPKMGSWPFISWSPSGHCWHCQFSNNFEKISSSTASPPAPCMGEGH